MCPLSSQLCILNLLYLKAKRYRKQEKIYQKRLEGRGQYLPKKILFAKVHCSSWCKSFPSFPFTQKSARRHTKRRAIFFALFHTMTTFKARSNEVLPTCYISQLIVCNLTQVTKCRESSIISSV